MNAKKLPPHLYDWWKNQYEVVQEFSDVLLHEESASPQLLDFFETLASNCPKMRSVRMTNALHAFWSRAQSRLALEIAIRHFKTPEEVRKFQTLIGQALPQQENWAAFEAAFDANSPIHDIRDWLDTRVHEYLSPRAPG